MTAPADLDGDGLANGVEYANVEASGETLDDFWIAVVDPFAKGFPLPSVGWTGLLVLSLIVWIFYALFVNSSSRGRRSFAKSGDRKP